MCPLQSIIIILSLICLCVVSQTSVALDLFGSLSKATHEFILTSVGTKIDGQATQTAMQIKSCSVLMGSVL